MFSSWAVKNGGTLYPICFSPKLFAGLSILNPSLTINSEGLATFVFRISDYLYYRPLKNFESLTSTGAIQYLHLNEKKLNHIPFFVAKMDLPINTRKSMQIIYIDTIITPIMNSNSDLDFSTLEDLRICENNQNLVFIGNIATKNNKRRPLYFQIDKENLYENVNHEICINSVNLIEQPNFAKIEKNWVPIEGEKDRFIRWPQTNEGIQNKLALVFDTSKELPIKTETVEDSTIFGGSPFVKFKSGYLTIVHSRKEKNRKNNHQYFHHFNFYNQNFELVKSSNKFTFLNYETEFCSGISISNNNIYLSFSCNDSLNFLLSFKESLNIWTANFE